MNQTTLLNTVFSALLCAFSSLYYAPSHAQSQKKANEIYFDHENRDEFSPWEEEKWGLPAFPRTENLLNFYVSPVNFLQFSIDSASLQVGKDNVVRFVLVVKSRSGATNVSYEGLRCATRERRNYAIGRTQDQSWSITPRSEWRAIEYVHNNNHFSVFANEYACDIRTIVTGGGEEIVRRLKNAHRESTR